MWAAVILCKQFGTGKGVDFRISGSSSGFGLDPEAKVSMKQKGRREVAKWTLLSLPLKEIADSNS